ncbi:DNA/RNA nuclease SfsA [uncultured Secundilactobacillus sp.]|uniref:DNA/RNA nuclease SfsA n=1 Tax=uncultured Secundilactobacillus sp. TaxID=2813935 RepID=UPI00258A9AFD|nr:DNA/RNA nuclease SfsA [uncultured Secundilactobacillus sp.]
MRYPEVRIATFINRENRFIAHCELNGEVVTVHVKNTGRGKEVFLPGVHVALNYAPGPKRKTDYDLVAVEKAGRWINIDSQAPNKVVMEAYQEGRLKIPGLPEWTAFRGEVRYRESRIDFWGRTEDERDCWLEVKGVTLENAGLAAFPDAPTVRAVKHVHDLITATREGAWAVLLFVIQMSDVDVMTIYQDRAPKLAAAIREAQAAGVKIVAYRCEVTPDTLRLATPALVDLDREFKEQVVIQDN